ncbi:cytochrome P450 [Mycena latifolia]|nr:cytochrome P450 [Mycena latifolia]
MHMDDTDRFILLASLWIVYTIALLLIVWAAVVGGRALLCALHTTAMPGPPPRSFFRSAADGDSLDISKCCRLYGPVFQVRTGPFSKKLVICDAAAIAHFYANAPIIYRATNLVRERTKNLVKFMPLETCIPFIFSKVGRGVIWVDGDQHSGYRQALSPVFSDSAVESHYSPVFFQIAQIQSMWNGALESRPRGMVVDIQHWMNSVVLDSLGVAGFSHDFESLNGDYCIVTAAFYALRAPSTNSISDIIFRLATNWSFLRDIPTAKNRIIKDFQTCMRRIASDVHEKNTGKDVADKSVLALLSFENTAVALSWLLVELAKNPMIQDKLRNELLHVNAELTHNEIVNLPYLHAVVYETLRLHPPMGDATRVAAKDDVIPLSSPVTARAGGTVTNIHVAKGTVISVPIRHVNISEAFWGPGSSTFNPERYWQDESNTEFPGNRHLAFGDGPRTCLGASFSLSLIKAVLSVIVSNFNLSLPEGPQTIVESTSGRIPQPRVSGQGSEVLMVVRRL